MDYEEPEKSFEEIRKINDELLELFEKDLEEKKFSDKIISRHISNVSFYINQYLLREEVRPMEDGIGEISMFLGDFFIRKCMWSTPQTIKSTAASIKKFYMSMLNHGKIKKKDYEYLCEEIKEGMDDWQADCALFNNPDAPNPFAWF